jgi:hypothetical protein
MSYETITFDEQGMQIPDANGEFRYAHMSWPCPAIQREPRHASKSANVHEAHQDSDAASNSSSGETVVGTPPRATPLALPATSTKTPTFVENTCSSICVLEAEDRGSHNDDDRSGIDEVRVFHPAPASLCQPGLPPFTLNNSPIVWACKILHGRQVIEVTPFCFPGRNPLHYMGNLKDRLHSDYPAYQVNPMNEMPRYYYGEYFHIEPAPLQVPVPMAPPMIQANQYPHLEYHPTAQHDSE